MFYSTRVAHEYYLGRWEAASEENQGNPTTLAGRGDVVGKRSNPEIRDAFLADPVLLVLPCRGDVSGKRRSPEIRDAFVANVPAPITLVLHCRGDVSTEKEQPGNSTPFRHDFSGPHSLRSRTRSRATDTPRKSTTFRHRTFIIPFLSLFLHKGRI